ncbi:hypothetical protein [Vibrio phage vB_VpaP_SJSY21]|nr:hypothetical protein [Vibrio phage vB_VpaP_SJSY21]
MKVHNTVAKALLNGNGGLSSTNVGQYGSTEQDLRPIGGSGEGCGCDEELELLAENLNQKIELEMRNFRDEVNSDLGSITASATGTPNGNPARAEYSPTRKEFLFVIPDGAPGSDGYTPVKGVDYFDGKDGTDGAKGDPGYTPVKGVDYFDGAKGDTGDIGPEGRSDNGLVIFDTVPGSPVTVDINAGYIYSFDLKDPTTNVVINDIPQSHDRGVQITLMIKQTTGSNLINITTQNGGTIKWPNGLKPRLSYEAGSVDVLTLLSIDGGVSYFGFLSGSDFK